MFMNMQKMDVLRTIMEDTFVNQRMLSEASGHSLGVINRSIKQLISEGYLTDQVRLTGKAKQMIAQRIPKNAIILAAGYGTRMIPINLSTPKALLEVHGERLIDRLIKQLHSVGIEDITVVVGYMKECFEYLIDEYGVDLVINEEYVKKNNLHSLALVADRIHNTYIIPCDIWCDRNPFGRTELYSWYMVSDLPEEVALVRVNRNMELVKVSGKTVGNHMIGISYIIEPEATVIREQLEKLDDEEHMDDFWEEVLYRNDRMILPAKLVCGTEVVEINTYEQLRALDADSNHLKSDAMEMIAKVLQCKENEILDISVLKKGMTNRSFLFRVGNEKYIMRIPGEGTDQLINRRQEADVYRIISGLGICDDPVCMNPVNGYKITKYLEGIRVCDPQNVSDLERCMEVLKRFHALNLKISHTFDIFGQIEFYEELRGGASIYRDYLETKRNVFSLKKYVSGIDKDWCLTHIDAVPDNFLFYRSGSEELLQLTDWEYAGMQDPHVDIAMFCIYSLFNRKQCDKLIDVYFDNGCDPMVRIKIYCYISMCGLLWSNWCEYKRELGVEFGAYSLRQYRYAKDFFKYAKESMLAVSVSSGNLETEGGGSKQIDREAGNIG